MYVRKPVPEKQTPSTKCKRSLKRGIGGPCPSVPLSATSRVYLYRIGMIGCPVTAMNFPLSSLKYILIGDRARMKPKIAV